jgi:hypothetical protein
VYSLISHACSDAGPVLLEMQSWHPAVPVKHAVFMQAPLSLQQAGQPVVHQRKIIQRGTISAGSIWL